MGTDTSDRWAMLIGIDGYHESLGRLKYSVNDCRRLAEVLTAGEDAFRADHVLVLADDEVDDRKPTYAHIHSWLASWLSQPDEDDTIIVFFAGHGREMDGKCYLVPADATLQTIHVTGIAVPYIQDLLNRCKARQKVLIVDACHSGAGRDVVTMGPSMLETLSASKGIYTLTACDVDELSHEWDEKKQGVFSYYLAEALSGTCPPDGRGHVTADGVYEWVFDRVRDWARTHRCSQAPKRVCDTTGAIILRHAEPDWRRLATDLQTQLADTRHELEQLKQSQLSQQQAAPAPVSVSDAEGAAVVLNDWASRRPWTVRPLVDGKRRSIRSVECDEFIRITLQVMRETRTHKFFVAPGRPKPGEEPVAEDKPFDPWSFGDYRCPDGWSSASEEFFCIPAIATGTCCRCQGKKKEDHRCRSCSDTGFQTQYREIRIDWKSDTECRLWKKSRLGDHFDARIPRKAAVVVLLDETRMGSNAPDTSSLPPEIASQLTQLVQQVLRGVNGKVRKVRCVVESLPVQRVTVACGSRPFEAEIWGTNRQVRPRSRAPRSPVRVFVTCTIGTILIAGGIAMTAFATGFQPW